MAAMGVAARGRIAVLADVTPSGDGAGISQAGPLPTSLNQLLDPSQPQFWVAVLLAASTLYLLGAYVMLAGVRVPL